VSFTGQFTVVKLNNHSTSDNDFETMPNDAEYEYCSNFHEANQVALKACKLYARVMVYLMTDTSKPVLELSNVRT
jgi:hypothetical protein